MRYHLNFSKIDLKFQQQKIVPTYNYLALSIRFELISLKNIKLKSYKNM